MSDFDWSKKDSMVHVCRAEMSSSQFKEVKMLAVSNGKTFQAFVGDILKQAVRKHKKG